MSEISTKNEVIKKYILSNVTVDEVDEDFDLFESGIVNSLFVIQLITYIEKQFSIKVTMEDLDMSNFKTINSIETFIRKKQGGK